MRCPLCKGKQVVACFKDCRYQDGLGWRTCLTRCLTDNALVLDMFLKMLPDEEDEHAAPAAAVASKHATEGQGGDLSSSRLLLRGSSGVEAAARLASAGTTGSSCQTWRT